jgi:hypothetical protein
MKIVKFYRWGRYRNTIQFKYTKGKSLEITLDVR